MAHYIIDTHGELEPHLRQEWLLTNALGAFASSTVLGCNTRRYHGILCAATLPPVGRKMMLNRIGEILTFDDAPDRLLEFSINQFDAARFHPRGDLYLRRFELDQTARFEYDVEGIGVQKEIQLLWKRNAAAVRYTITPPPGRAVRLQLLPFVSLRDFHAERRTGKDPFSVHAGDRAVSVGDHDLVLHLRGDRGSFVQQSDWWYGHYYAIEAERGLDAHEDLFCPGRFTCAIADTTTLTIWASIDESMDDLDWAGGLAARSAALGAALRAQPEHSMEPRATPQHSPTIRRLLRAAADFVVDRVAPDGSPGSTILAGYPWFSDWGRDTMISLPGLLLCTGRFDQARQVLSLFAQYISEGMIPNRFDDYTNEPSYNTVDASLWFIHAVHEYVRCTDDYHTYSQTLQDACRAIIDGYRRGTRFHIRMDPADGLIAQGDAGTQLTWMDAKCGDRAFTPRQGKPVEINALWYHALVLMGETALAQRVAAGFRQAFWISPFRGLADVIDLDRRDTAIRPNQIFAVSLPNSPLDDDQQRAVVEVVRRELLTPMGLRTLGRGDPNYHGHYVGSPMQRDEAYHNGTVWAWLLGAFLDAYLRVNRESAESVIQARRWLDTLLANMQQTTIGQISEIFDGDAPHRPVGCPAQAWSVAEALRLAMKLKM